MHSKILSFQLITLVAALHFVVPSTGAQGGGEVLVPGPDQELWLTTDRPAPRYPRRAVDERLVGCAVVQFIVERDGTTSNHRVIFSTPEDVFDREAIRAIERWRFEPAPDNPDSEPALLTQTLSFALVGEAGVSCVPADDSAAP